MAASEGDRSLELRMPWGRPSRPQAAPEPVEPALPDPPPAVLVNPPPEPSPPMGALPDAGAAGGGPADERLLRLESEISRRFDRLEERATRQDADLEAHLDKLQAAHAASVEASGMLAGHLVTRLSDELARVEAAQLAWNEQALARIEEVLGRRHEELLAKLDGTRAELVATVGSLASREVVDRLLEGVATIGELLDDELVDLRRLVEAGQDGAGAPATPGYHDLAPGAPDPATDGV